MVTLPIIEMCATAENTNKLPAKHFNSKIAHRLIIQLFGFISENPHCHSNFSAYTCIQPFLDQEPVNALPGAHVSWLLHHLPLYAAAFIEDDDPEWRDLDYSVDIGEPPESFCEFVRQYDWKMYDWDETDMYAR